MSLALIGIIAILLGFNFWRERQYDKLTEERERAWRLERTALLQRIQAPEVAVVEQAERPEVEPPQVISVLDDESFNKVRAERG